MVASTIQQAAVAEQGDGSSGRASACSAVTTAEAAAVPVSEKVATYHEIPTMKNAEVSVTMQEALQQYWRSTIASVAADLSYLLHYYGTQQRQAAAAASEDNSITSSSSIVVDAAADKGSSSNTSSSSSSSGGTRSGGGMQAAAAMERGASGSGNIHSNKTGVSEVPIAEKLVAQRLMMHFAGLGCWNMVTFIAQLLAPVGPGVTHSTTEAATIVTADDDGSAATAAAEEEEGTSTAAAAAEVEAASTVPEPAAVVPFDLRLDKMAIHTGGAGGGGAVVDVAATTEPAAGNVVARPSEPKNDDDDTSEGHGGDGGGCWG